MSARRQERRDQQPIWSFVLLELLAFRISLVGSGTYGTLALSRAVYTRAVKYLTWRGMQQKRAERSGARGIPPRAIGVDRALRAARLFPCY